jgi:hypothetical protein
MLTILNILPVVCGLGILSRFKPINKHSSQLKLLRIDARNQLRFPESTNYCYSGKLKD